MSSNNFGTQPSSSSSGTKKTLDFSKVIQLITASGKPVVGHNCFLDLCFILEKFIAPLPVSPHEFLLSVRNYFSDLYDTKHMIISHNRLRSVWGTSSTLEDICHIAMDDSRWEKQPRVVFAPGFDRYLSTDGESPRNHEAGEYLL